MKILFVSAEVAPLAKTGGLGDVAGALPPVLRAMGHDVRIAMPRYASLKLGETPQEHLPHPIGVPLGAGEFPAWISGIRMKGDTPLYLVSNPHFFGRDQIYGYWDDDGRFIFFSRACLEMCRALDWMPDIVHCNDWHTAVIPNYLFSTLRGMFPETASVMTIHNLAYQGQGGFGTLEFAGLAHEGFIPTAIWQQDYTVNLMARGILLADMVNAVSPRYAQEILTPEYGENLQHLLWLNRDKLVGILNGIDYSEWSPEVDGALLRGYSVEDLDGKVVNKRALQRELNLEASDQVAVLGLVTRLVDQKGIDLIMPIIDRLLMEQPVQLAVLASGEPRYEDWLYWLGQRHPGRVSVNLRFDAGLSRRIYAGSDMFLMPSRFEPCGIGQMIALRYGSVPVVRATGGLADTVVDADVSGAAGTGFVFADYHPMALHWALTRALHAFRNRERWRELMRRGMRADYSWERSARQYVEVYEQAKSRRLAGVVGRRFE